MWCATPSGQSSMTMHRVLCSIVCNRLKHAEACAEDPSDHVTLPVRKCDVDFCGEWRIAVMLVLTCYIRQTSSLSILSPAHLSATKSSTVREQRSMPLCLNTKLSDALICLMAETESCPGGRGVRREIFGLRLRYLVIDACCRCGLRPTCNIST